MYHIDASDPLGPLKSDLSISRPVLLPHVRPVPKPSSQRCHRALRLYSFLYPLASLSSLLLLAVHHPRPPLRSIPF